MPKERQWRIGVLFSQSGSTAAAEMALLNGTMLAVNKINASGGVDGKQIEVLSPDPGGVASNFRELARQLADDEGISVFFGGYTSISRKAMVPAIEETNSLLFYPTFYEGFEYSDHVFYFGSCPNQYTVQLVNYMMRTFGPSFYLVGANYVFPRESNRIIKELLKQKSGTLVAEKYLDLDSSASQVKNIVRDIEKRNPDVIFSTLVGDQISHFYEAYDRTELRKSGVPIGSIVTSETEIDLMGADVAEGHFCVANYFSSLESPESVQFVNEYKASFGEHSRPSSLVEAAYNQVLVFAKALQTSKSMELEKLRKAVLNTSIQAPQGQIKMNAENHHTHLWSRIGFVDARGNVVPVVTSNAPITPDPYLVTHEFENQPGETDSLIMPVESANGIR